MKRKHLLSTAAAGILLTCGATLAAPLVQVSILGSTSANGPFSSTLSIAPNTTYYFEVVERLAPVGTTNTHGNITSIDPSTNKDGINSTSINLAASAANITFNSQGLTLASSGTTPAAIADWNGSSSAAVGTVGANQTTITGIRGIHAAGVFNAADGNDVVEFGTFSVIAAPSGTTMINGAFGGTGSTGRANGTTKSIIISTTTEASADPYVGYNPLELDVVAAPEPGCLGLLAVGGVALLRRRRSKTRKQALTN
jgi:hypothetical protein